MTTAPTLPMNTMGPTSSSSVQTVILQVLKEIAAEITRSSSSTSPSQLQASQSFEEKEDRIHELLETRLVPVVKQLPPSLVKMVVEDAFRCLCMESCLEAIRTESGTVEKSENQEDEHGQLFTTLDTCLVYTESSSLDASYVDHLLPLSMIEEVMEQLPIDGAIQVFNYMEQRADKLTKGLEPQKAKGLCILRLCNELLRRLSKTRHSVESGRIRTFLACIYPLNERSGVNLRGDFNTENVTLYEGMDDMETDAENATEETKFYKTFWGLQKYFSNPLLMLSEPSQLSTFKSSVEAVLAYFEKLPDSVKKSKSNDAAFSSHTPFFPKYLTSSNLFQLQLSDVPFRRQILVQMLMAQYFLTSLLAKEKEQLQKSAKPSSTFYVMTHETPAEEEEWLVNTKKRILCFLDEDGSGASGYKFRKAVVHVLNLDSNWWAWKCMSCPQYDKEKVEFDYDAVYERVKGIMEDETQLPEDTDLEELFNMTETDILQDLQDRASSIRKPLSYFLEILDGEKEDGFEEEEDSLNTPEFQFAMSKTLFRDHYELFRHMDPKRMLRDVRSAMEMEQKRVEGLKGLGDVWRGDVPVVETTKESGDTTKEGDGAKMDVDEEPKSPTKEEQELAESKETTHEESQETTHVVRQVEILQESEQGAQSITASEEVTITKSVVTDVMEVDHE